MGTKLNQTRVPRLVYARAQTSQTTGPPGVMGGTRHLGIVQIQVKMCRR